MYELTTIYEHNQSLTDEQYQGAFETQIAGGATGAASYLALTGPLTGRVAMTSRWNSLDAITAWLEAIAPMLAPGGAFHQPASANPIMSRVLTTTIREAGTPSAEYVMVTRGTRGIPNPDADARIEQVTMASGVTGFRASLFSFAAEYEGQVHLAFHADSADRLAELPGVLQGDEQIASFVAEAGATVISRTLFRRLAERTQN